MEWKMSKRIKTNYPGVFYREATRLGGKGFEKVFYIVFKKSGKVIEEKVGRKYTDDMTPARASKIRGERIEGKRLSPKEERKAKVDARNAELNKWTISRLWVEYKRNKPDLKGIVSDENRFKNYINPIFGIREPKELIPLDVDRLRLNLLKKKSPGTVKNVLELLRRIINFGTKKNLCEGISFTIEMPKVNNLRTEDLSAKELESLLAAINKDSNIMAAHMMKLALFTGMRRGELFKLKWNNIDFNRRFILLKDPKGQQDQKIPINDWAKRILEDHPRTDSPYVFPGRNGQQRTDIKKAVNRIKEHAGLPKDFRSLHGLRHVYASMLASSGQVDMYTLQKLLTHKSPAMTQRYAHLRDEKLKEAADVAGEIINKAVNDTNAGNPTKVVNMK
jgi:integrase